MMRRRPVLLSVVGVVFLSALLVPLAGCGGSEGTPTAATSKEAGCQVGASALPLIPKAPAWWTEGPGPTLALACLDEPDVGEAVILGYSSPESTGGHCINAYNLSGEWSAGEKCAAPGVEWNWWCKGAQGKKAQGCVWGFVHNGDVTGVAGMLTAKVKEVHVLVRGKPLKRGVMVAHVHGRTSRLTGAEEPFGFFAAYIHGCVRPREVKVEMLGPAGSRIGTALGYSAPASCPKRS
jgi:hypothetical protein